MNLLQGRLRVDGGWRVATADGDMALKQPLQATAWEPWLGREVVLGIRPEGLLPLRQDAGDVALCAQLEVLEPVGNEVFLNLRFGAKALISRVATRQLPEPGSTVRLSVGPSHLHLFDAENGMRIND